MKICGLPRLMDYTNAPKFLADDFNRREEWKQCEGWEEVRSSISYWMNSNAIEVDRSIDHVASWLKKRLCIVPHLLASSC